MKWHDCKTDPPIKSGKYVLTYRRRNQECQLRWDYAYYDAIDHMWHDVEEYECIFLQNYYELLEWPEVDLNMTINEKQKIAAIARNLIEELKYCDDEEFVDLILECVRDADLLPLYPDYL